MKIFTKKFKIFLIFYTEKNAKSIIFLTKIFENFSYLLVNSGVKVGEANPLLVFIRVSKHFNYILFVIKFDRGWG